MNWLQLVGSIAAILVLAGIAWGMGLGGGGIADDADAMRTAEDALSGFDAVRAVVGSDGKAALVYAIDGRIAVIKLHGAHHAVRPVAAADIAESTIGWTVDPRDRLFGELIVRK